LYQNDDDEYDDDDYYVFTFICRWIDFETQLRSVASVHVVITNHGAFEGWYYYCYLVSDIDNDTDAYDDDDCNNGLTMILFMIVLVELMTMMMMMSMIIVRCNKWLHVILKYITSYPSSIIIYRKYDIYEDWSIIIRNIWTLW